MNLYKLDDLIDKFSELDLTDVPFDLIPDFINDDIIVLEEKYEAIIGSKQKNISEKDIRQILHNKFYSMLKIILLRFGTISIIVDNLVPDFDKDSIEEIKEKLHTIESGFIRY